MQGEKGFTLIELSIVLVIISLIVGGVIGGKSLIRSAELGDITSGLNKYKTAYNTFKLQYDALPGDMRDAQDYWPSCVDVGANLCNGNGDGKVGPAGGELFRSWQHLGLADVVNIKYTGSSVTPVIPGENVPEGVSSGTVYQIFSVPAFLAIMYGNTGNWVHYSNDYSGSVAPYASLSGREAKSLDKKIDNGDADSGNVQVWKYMGTGCVDQIFAPPVATDFVLDDTQLNCVISMRLD